MGLFSGITKQFRKVTGAVKKVVKGVAKNVKKTIKGVAKVVKKIGKGVKKLASPVENPSKVGSGLKSCIVTSCSLNAL